MTTKIVAMFNLKPGVSAADYEAWARETDLPTVNGLKSVDKFEIFKSTAVLGSDAQPPYGYIELIDVNDMDVFGGEVGSETMQKLVAAFQDMVTDVVFILTDKVG